MPKLEIQGLHYPTFKWTSKDQFSKILVLRSAFIILSLRKFKKNILDEIDLPD